MKTNILSASLWTLAVLCPFLDNAAPTTPALLDEQPAATGIMIREVVITENELDLPIYTLPEVVITATRVTP